MTLITTDPRATRSPDAASDREFVSNRGSILPAIWADWRVGVAAAVALAGLFALVAAWITPRGPITSSDALVAMAVAGIVGLGAGVAIANRWSLLVAPLTFIVVFELARLGVSGPTVDLIDIGSTLGVIAFVTGRVAHGIIVILPMLLGARVGIRAAARLGHPDARPVGRAAWVVTGLLALVVGVVGVSIARPATTAAIVGPDGEPLATSVAEIVTLEIGGHDQTVLIRGRNVENPVLLYLAGGPGGTDFGALRRDTALEGDFVVAAWDQRGAGTSYAALDPVDTLTVDRLIADTVEVTNYLRERFDEDRIYLVGNSWGTTLGVLTAQQHPELFHAVIGTGQMVSQRATDIMFWEDTLAWAEATGRDGLVESLTANGPPPYDDVAKYELTVAYEHEWNDYPELDLDNEMPAILFVPEYSWMDRINAFRGFLDSAAVIYPQLQDIDFRTQVPSLDVPLHIVLGEHEARGRSVLAREWFDLVDAPSKTLTVVDGAGHRVLFDRPDAFADLMNRVRTDTIEGATR